MPVNFDTCRQINEMEESKGERGRQIEVKLSFTMYV